MDFNSLLDHRRSIFINYLVNTNQYITLALLSQCITTLDEKMQHPAAILCVPGQRPVVKIHPLVLSNGDQFIFNFCMLHELNHLPHAANPKWYLQAVFPPDITTEYQQKALARAFGNAAKDMALHEHLKASLGNDLQSKIRDFMLFFFQQFNDKPITDDDKLGCFAENLKDAKLNMDYHYYFLKIVQEALEKQKGSDPDACDLFGVMIDDHGGWGEGDESLTPEQKDQVAREIQKLIDASIAEGELMARQAGREPSDMHITLGQQKLSQRVREFIQKIKTKINRCHQGKTSSKYSYNKINKLWPNMPGRIPFVERSSGIVFVGDVSGSMCLPELLNQLIPVVKQLEQRGILAASFACDVALSPFGRIVEGGGGTDLNPSHAEEIRKKIGLKPGALIDIVYATDGYVDLTELSKDPTVNLHVLILEEEKAS